MGMEPMKQNITLAIDQRLLKRGAVLRGAARH
jgi:hypothetical protein